MAEILVASALAVAALMALLWLLSPALMRRTSAFIPLPPRGRA